MPVKPIPEGYNSITPYLIVQDVAKVIDFVKRAFDAEEIHRATEPDGTVMHAEMNIGDSKIMMGEVQGGFTPMPGSLYLYVKDTDATYKRALQAGAASVMEPADQFYGDRNAGVRDSAGNIWWIATHVEDVPPDELEKRAQAHSQQRQAE